MPSKRKKVQRVKKRTRSFVVGGATYTRIYKEDFAETTGQAGECNYTDKILTIEKSFEGKDLTSTTIHELLHAFCEEYGFNQILQVQTRELLCEGLSQLLTHVPILDIKVK